eukprot:scaffold239023_cov32-Tisochrysis_lutea.AAC.3
MIGCCLDFVTAALLQSIENLRMDVQMWGEERVGNGNDGRERRGGQHGGLPSTGPPTAAPLAHAA